MSTGVHMKLKKIIVSIMIILSFSLSCVKQKNRFNEPTLTPENYDQNATKIYDYYYKKHLSNVLNRSDQLQITKDQRGNDRSKQYSRIVVVDTRAQAYGNASSTDEKRNHIVCIENYGLKDKSGFNSFDYIMYSKYVYNYEMNKVIHYKVLNGDKNKLVRIDDRFFTSEEANAFLLSDRKFYSITRNLFKFKGLKRIKLKKRIQKQYSLGTRSEFLIKKIEIVKVIEGTMTTSGVGSAQGISMHSYLVYDMIFENNEKLRCMLIYVPKNIAPKVKERKTYDNVVITIDDQVFNQLEVQGLKNTYAIVTSYVRGLEHLLTETSQDENENSNTDSSTTNSTENTANTES